MYFKKDFDIKPINKIIKKKNYKKILSMLNTLCKAIGKNKGDVNKLYYTMSGLCCTKSFEKGYNFHDHPSFALERMIELYEKDLVNASEPKLVEYKEGFENYFKIIQREISEYNIKQKEEFTFMTLVDSCIKFKHEKTLNFLLRQPELQKYTNSGKTALHIAVERNMVDLVKFLLEQGNIDVNALDPRGRTAVQIAGEEHNEKEIFEILINHEGTDLNVLYEDGSTLLHKAVKFEDGINCIKVLIKKININAKDEFDHTPLYSAIECRRAKNAKFLIEQKGIDLYVLPKNGMSFPNLAVYMEDLEFFKYLLQHMKRITNIPPNILFWIVEKCDAETLELTITDQNIMDEDGAGMLHHAAASNNVEAIEFLIKRGYNVNKINNRGYTPIQYAIKNENIEAIEALLNFEGTNINSIERNLGTNRGQRRPYIEFPLHTACRVGNNKIIKLLLDFGANPKCLNYFMQRPIELVPKFKQKEIKMLFRKQINNRTNNKLAAASNDIESLTETRKNTVLPSNS